MNKWEYEQVARELDKICFAYIKDEIDHPTKVAKEQELLEKAGWTEDEFMTELENRLPF